METLNDHFELVQDLKDIYQKSYVEYLTELQGWESNSQEVGGGQIASLVQLSSLQVHDIEDILVHAFATLDSDMSREAIPAEGDSVNTLSD